MVMGRRDLSLYSPGRALERLLFARRGTRVCTHPRGSYRKWTDVAFLQVHPTLFTTFLPFL